jgi:AcrR family transcriptional regulator
MGSTDTMALLGNSFITLAEHLPIQKISVSDIVAASGKNRKTFYYHFEGKESLIRWIYRSDIASQLKSTVSPDELVYEREGEGALPTLPYYVRRKSGVRSLDGSVFLKSLAACFEHRRDYYAKVLRISGPDSLQAYLRRLYATALADDIRFILSNRYLAEGNVSFLSEFYAGALVSYMVERVCDPTCADILADVKPFENIVHSSIESEIKQQQLKRVL